jgi:8-oxo-dGTP diphosphatase
MQEPRFDEKGCHNCNHHNMNHKSCDINTICYQGCEWEVIPEPLSVFKTSEVVPLTDEEEVKQKYVVGFMFTEDCKHVVLIRKNKPTWQVGKLNGVGGKIEPNETPLNAMIREYREEATMIYEKWDNFLTIEYKTCVVYFFKGFNDECYQYSETKEEEQIEKINIDFFPEDEVIPNLNWIVNLALDDDIKHADGMEEYARQFQPEEIDLKKELNAFTDWATLDAPLVINPSELSEFIDEYLNSK